jgi:DNA-binding LytR/AlgR family response regulator
MLQALASSEPAVEDGAGDSGSSVVVHERGTVRVFDARRVTRFRAADKYTLFRVDGDEYLVRDSLEQLEQRLAPHGFVRVHRAELVRGDACVALVREPGGASLELSDGQHVAVSRRYLAEAKRILGVT